MTARDEEPDVTGPDAGQPAPAVFAHAGLATGTGSVSDPPAGTEPDPQEPEG